MIAFAQKAEGTTKNVDAAVLTGAFGYAALPCQDGVIEIVVNVAGNEKVEQAVAVVVAPSCARGPAAKSDARFFGDVGERAVVIVVVEAILSVVGHVNVGPAVVIVIGDGDAQPPAPVRNAGLVASSGRGASMLLVTRHRRGRRLGAFGG